MNTHKKKVITNIKHYETIIKILSHDEFYDKFELSKPVVQKILACDMMKYIDATDKMISKEKLLKFNCKASAIGISIRNGLRRN